MCCWRRGGACAAARTGDEHRRLSSSHSPRSVHGVIASITRSTGGIFRMECTTIIFHLKERKSVLIMAIIDSFDTHVMKLLQAIGFIYLVCKLQFKQTHNL